MFVCYIYFSRRGQKLGENTGVLDQKQMGLVASGVSLSFDGQIVLNNVDITLKSGSIHAITGENGAGKSSLAKVIAGLYRADSASINLNGQKKELRNPKQALSEGIALIHQEPLTFPDLTIGENILAGNLPKKGGKVDWGKVHQTSQKLLADLGSSLDTKATAGTLSIADQQILELAAALAHQAKVWIFDETTAPLTPPEVARLFKIIRELRDQGCCIAIVTHHLDEVFEIADEITVLRSGERVAHLGKAETTQDEIVRLMVGSEVFTHRPERNPVGGSTILKVEGLTGVGFQDVSLEVRQGEIFGLTGLVGAGRTEFARALFGITKPKSGRISLAGEEHQPSSPAESIRRGVVLVPEDRRGAGLMLDQSIGDNAALAHLPKFSPRFGIIDQKKSDSKIQPLIQRLKTKLQSLSQLVGQLSGGNQQKVVLAKWLLETPKLLIIDEPTRGVDIGAKADVHALLRELADQGVPILLISSDLPEVLALSDRIGVMRRGTLVGTLGAESATKEAIVALATGGSA